MKGTYDKCKQVAGLLGSFVRWVLLACVLGGGIGVVSVLFHHGIELATELRMDHPWVLLLLPAAGAAIVMLYRICDMAHDRGTNQIFLCVREGKPVRLRTAPLIFISTILTHLVGGSAGREGAALQLGGSLAGKAGQLLRLDEKDRRILIMCGMSAAFSGLFGTPLTAAVFALEVVSVGVMYHAALVPCLCAALMAAEAAKLLGAPAAGYALTAVPDMTLPAMGQAAVLGVLCALVSVLFCRVVHAAPGLYAKIPVHSALRGVLGGVLVLGLTIAVGSQDYNGAGGHIIARAVEQGQAVPWAFLLKILFTAVALGAGFRGGEIVPVLFTGATFGCTVAPVLGLDPGFGGALGMVALFCGTTNCPVASILLSVELFGAKGLPLFALACAVAYMTSGYHGLYSEQKIMYSKFRTEWVGKNAH
ncbi:MAG: chloride channel protein [Ruminococcaceae bacterium]|nr:chloride channel protein [Oscillospiraceae bacterium]